MTFEWPEGLVWRSHLGGWVTPEEAVADVRRRFPVMVRVGALEIGVTHEDLSQMTGAFAVLCAVCSEEAAGDCASCDRKLCDEHRCTTSVPGDSFCLPGQGCSPQPCE